MFEYFYFICTKPIKNKYSIKKMIYNNKILYQEEDSLLTINQVNKLLVAFSIVFSTIFKTSFFFKPAFIVGSI